MPVDHQRILDNITRVKEYWASKREQAKLRPNEREQILGLRFKKGQEVKDNVSGEKATVIAGTREIVGVRSARSKGH